MTKSKSHNFKIASDGEITVPNYIATVFPFATAKIDTL